jgi:nicotinate-nucleotide--dimethylbenzimidazole phosphoribosyltransferase
MTLPPLLRDLVTRVRPPDRAADAAVRTHLDALTKPVGALGRLEDLARRIATIRGDPPDPFVRRAVYVLAADHGVTLRGVSAYPREVTAQMCRNYAAGGAAINVIARAVRADVFVVDMGVDADLSDLDGILHRKIGRGTADLAATPAMTRDEALRAVAVGAALVDESPPCDIVALGEMGIGNTTAATAMTAALVGRDVTAVLGRGTGIDDAGLVRKRDAVERGVARLRSDADPLTVLTEVGGFELAGLAGLVLGAAAAARPVVLDGFISSAAALVAVRWCPAAAGYLFASHCSTEPGHRILLDALDLHPLLDLELRLGEGTGAALALPLFDAAAGLLREMATFERAGVSTHREPGS